MAGYEVVFQGKAKEGVTPEQARARIGQLFKADDKQLDVLFSGRRVVIKQGLDQTAAEKYRQAIERAGAVCVIQPMSNGVPADNKAAEAPAQTPAQPTPTSNPEPAPAAPAAPAALQPRDEFMAAFSDVDAPDLPIAPLGADMQHEYADHVPLDLDLSAYTLAPPGSDLEQLATPTPPALPDTSHLQLMTKDAENTNISNK